MLGRPIFWGLAVGGADEVRGVLETLLQELELARALAGHAALATRDRSVVRAAPSV
jgi:isopentenyl diphosphate isomerase/L-lactate dehydrogenase-like FMN-dependent dehydrogenase